MFNYVALRFAHTEAPQTGKYPAYVKMTSYDEVLKPSGSFKELNAKKQQRNNMILAGGTLFLVGSIVVIKAMGVIDFVNPPDYKKLKLNV